MPFVTQEHRDKPDNRIPGDRCYLQYVDLMEYWNKEPRWTSIDNWARKVWSDDYQRAAALALLVFMHKHGFVYEDLKCKENGDIL